jgi:hypothetical protein
MPAVQVHLSTGGGQIAAQYAQQRGFARAVRADHRGDGARFELHADPPEQIETRHVEVYAERPQ